MPRGARDYSRVLQPEGGGPRPSTLWASLVDLAGKPAARVWFQVRGHPGFASYRFDFSPVPVDVFHHSDCKRSPFAGGTAVMRCPPPLPPPSPISPPRLYKELFQPTTFFFMLFFKKKIWLVGWLFFFFLSPPSGL